MDDACKHMADDMQYRVDDLQRMRHSLLTEMSTLHVKRSQLQSLINQQRIEFESVNNQVKKARTYVVTACIRICLFVLTLLVCMYNNR